MISLVIVLFFVRPDQFNKTKIDVHLWRRVFMEKRKVVLMVPAVPAAKEVIEQKIEAKTGNNDDIAFFRIVHFAFKYQIQRISQHKSHPYTNKERSIVHACWFDSKQK
jgi:hypothetical protein